MSYVCTRTSSTMTGNSPATTRKRAVGATLPTMTPLAHAILWVAAGALLYLPQHHAHAQTTASTQSEVSFEIPAGTLDQVLSRFGRQAGVQIAVDGAVTTGIKSQGVQGRFSAARALDILLTGTGLEAVRDAQGEYTLHKLPQTGETALPVVNVLASGAHGDSLAAPYAGGQVARGGRVGVFGQKDVMDTPFTVTNYTSELILNQQSRSVIDVLANDPSVVIGWPRDSYVDQFNVRGFNVLGEDITYGGLFGISPPGKVPMDIVERVEVIKGMSAFTRGIAPAASLGASINLVPKRATDVPVTRLTTSYESTGHVGAHLDIGRRFGSTGQFGVRANISYRDGETLKRGSAKEAATAVIGLDYRGDKFRFSADVGYDNLDVKRGEYWYFLDSNQFAIPSAPNPRTNTSQLWNRVRTNAQFAMARAEFDLTPNTMAYVTAGAQKTDVKAHLPEPIINNTQGDFTEYFQYRVVQRESHTAEAGLNHAFSTGGIDHALSLTATVLSQQSHEDRVFSGDLNSNIYNPVYAPEPDFFANPANAARMASPPLLFKKEFTSVALADTMTLLDGRVQLSGGVRHQSIDVRNYFRGTTRKPYNKNAWTFGGGLVVKPVNNVSLFVNYMEGLTQGPEAPAGTVNAGEQFAPYKSKQYEAGVKYDAGRWMMTASVFQVAKPNGQAELQSDGVSKLYVLNGEQRNRGVELGFTGEPVKGVRLLGGVMLLDAVMTRTEQGTLDGKRAAGAPKRNIRLGAEWDPVFAQGLTLTSRVSHASQQYVDSQNLQQIPGWTTFDLGARYVFALQGGQAVTLRADVRNLANKAYWASSIGSWLNAGSGRALAVSATVDF